MDIIKEFIANYGGELLLTAITAIFAFLGTALKKVVEDFVKDKEKKEIVKNVVKSVEQMYKNLHGTDKLDKAMKNASQMLSQKGIDITDLELMTLIEAAVCEFNDAFNKASWEDGLNEATSGDGVIEDETFTETETEPDEEVTAETYG